MRSVARQTLHAEGGEIGIGGDGSIPVGMRVDPEKGERPPFCFAVCSFGLIRPETESQIEDLHALLEFPADEIAAFLDEQAEQEEKVLPRVMSFVVTPEQESVIEHAVELASDGTAGRDRKARGLTNLAQRFLEERDGEVAGEGS